MRGSMIALVAAISLALPPVAAAQSAGEDVLDYELAMDCGVANAFLSGLIEQEDPATSAELLRTGETWLYLSYVRFSGDDSEYDALVELRSEELAEEIDALSSEDEIEEMVVTVLGSCELLREVVSDEFDAAAADLAG